MNAILLGLLALGAGGDYHIADEGGYATAASYDDGCAQCGHQHGHKHEGKWCGPMPQSCYNPPYGCYAGSRFSHRYPAFHGTYYRRPYNYRNVFDYPWHAQPHEPTSHFSYHVENEEVAPPQPEPASASYYNPLHRDVREALDVSVPTPARSASTSKLRTLRR